MDEKLKIPPRELPPDQQRKVLAAMFDTILVRQCIAQTRKWSQDLRIKDQLGETRVDVRPLREECSGIDDWRLCVLSCVESLPPLKRDVMLLKSEGKSFREVAELQGLPGEEQARLIHFRAKREVRKKAERKCGPKPDEF